MNIAKLKPFSSYTKKSAAIHIGIVVMMALLSYWKWDQGEQQKKANIKLVQSSVRVDVVSMPKLTIQELKALQKAGVTAGDAPKAEPKPVAKAKPAPEPETGKEFIKENDKAPKKPSFTDLMKKYSKNKVVEKAPKNKKKEEPKESGFDSNTMAKLKGLINRGNKVSQGQALVGEGGSENLTELQAYATQISNLVRPFWKLPSYLVDKELQCRIKIYIDERGKLIRSEVFESSGESEYDSRALKAVKLASPFPAPDSLISNRTVKGDILLGFPL